MNERAIDLYNQAANYAYSKIEKEFWGTEAFQGVIVGKFAELIVSECAGIDYKNASDGEFSGDDDYLISKIIKQHFGVE